MDRSQTLNPILPGAGVPRNAAQVYVRPPGQYDGSPTNSSEGGESDGHRRQRVAPKPKRKILRCKKPLLLSTFNARTLRVRNANNNAGNVEVSKMDELCYKLHQIGGEITGIQETKRKHEKDRREMVNSYPSAFGYTLYTISAWENEQQAATGGIGLMLGKTSHELLIGVERISDRIMKADFRGNPAMTIVVAYAPTEAAEESIKDTYFGQLRSTLETVPPHNFLAILTDANARFGRDDVLFTYNETTNDNGSRHLEVMEEHHLVAANTLFEKRPGKLWTWTSPHNTHHQLDYIFVRSKWKNSVTNCEAYSTFGSLFSDHRIVSAKVSLRLTSTKTNTTSKVTKYIWSDLATNREMQERYAVEVRNRYHLLLNESGDPVESDYDKFLQATSEAAKECLRPVPKSKKKVKSLDPRVKALREEVEEAYSAFLADRKSETSSEFYKKKKEELYDAYAIVDEEELTSMVTEAEQAHASSRHGVAWKLINEISGRHRAQTSKLKASSPEERVQTWFNHFSKLLGSPPKISEEDTPILTVFDSLGISEDPFSTKEFQSAKKSIRCGKACGEDGITPEFLKYGGLDDIVLGFVNQAYTEGNIPERWKTLIIVPVPKKGDLTKPDNYRGISLISLVMKLYNRLIMNRLRPALDPLLRTPQNGFREKRTTVGQIVALRRLLEGVRANNLSCVMTFIDFRKAFDTIHRGKLMQILRAYGVPEKIVTAIAATYSQTWAKVRTPDGDTESFEILAGVLQGDTLAPFLFIVALDYALRCAIDGREEELGFTLAKRASRRVPAKTLTDLDFADDISLVSDTTEKACKLLIEVESQCLRIGLGMNTKKTKVMAENVDNPEVRSLDGTLLDVVNDFNYLGAWIASTQKDIRIRRARAWSALHSMSKVWKSGMESNLKRRLFVTTVESVLLYGCEAWALTVRDEKALDGVYTRMLRAALDVSWKDHIRNIDLYGHLPRLSDTIRQRRMRLAGHCVRHPELTASELILWEPTHGKKSRGRPHATFIDTLKRDTGLSSANEIRTLMEDRGQWRAAVRNSRVGVT